MILGVCGNMQQVSAQVARHDKAIAELYRLTGHTVGGEQE
jgi:hypothetical protein